PALRRLLRSPVVTGANSRPSGLLGGGGTLSGCAIHSLGRAAGTLRSSSQSFHQEWPVSGSVRESSRTARRSRDIHNRCVRATPLFLQPLPYRCHQHSVGVFLHQSLSSSARKPVYKHDSISSTSRDRTHKTRSLRQALRLKFFGQLTTWLAALCLKTVFHKGSRLPGFCCF